jgi:hypothetical protein
MKSRVRRVEEKDRKRARRKHKDCKFDSLKDVKRPISFQRAKQRTIRDTRSRFAHRVCQTDSIIDPKDLKLVSQNRAAALFMKDFKIKVRGFT